MITRQQRCAHACPGSTRSRTRPTVGRGALLPLAETLTRLPLFKCTPSRGRRSGRDLWFFLLRLFFFAIAAFLALCHVPSPSNPDKGSINRKRDNSTNRRGSTERAETRSHLPPVHPRSARQTRSYQIRLRPAADPQKSYRYECQQRVHRLFSDPQRDREGPRVQRR
jgi:hypothetical protein